MNLEYIQAILPALLKGTWQTLQVFFLTLVLSLPFGSSVCPGIDFTLLSGAFFVKGIYLGVPRHAADASAVLCVLRAPHYVRARVPDGKYRSRCTYIHDELCGIFCRDLSAGVQSIDHGQHEAAKTLGFSRWQTMRIIIIPQTIARVIPPVSNEVITLIKDTALVTAIGVGELLKAAKDANNRDVNPTAFFIAAVIYLAITFLLTLLSQWCEKRFSRHERKEA